MLEDSRGMDGGAPSSAPRASTYDMAAWAAAAAAQTACTAAGAGMGAADMGQAAYHMRNQWGWGMNSLSQFHVNAPSGAWGLLGSDGLGSGAGGDARGAGSTNAGSLGGLSGLPALQQWFAMQQGGMQQGSVTRGLNGCSSSSQAAGLAPGAADAMEQHQAGGARASEGDARLGSGLPASFSLAEAMKQGVSASGVSDSFPALRNQYMHNAAAADAASRNAGSMQQPALVSDAVLAAAAAAANAPLPMLSGGQGPISFGDGMLMQQWKQQMLAMQNARHGRGSNPQQLQQQLSQQQQAVQHVVKHDQATPQQEKEAQQQQPISQQQKRGRAQEQQGSAGHGSNANKAQVGARYPHAAAFSRPHSAACRKPSPAL
jgi:hypothetical protein